MKNPLADPLVENVIVDPIDQVVRSLLLTGRIFDAVYAERIGLIDEVVVDAAGMDHAMDRFVDWVLTSAPEAAAETKRLVREMAHRARDQSLTEEMARRAADRRLTPEATEGLDAFFEHRKPAWRG